MTEKVNTVLITTDCFAKRVDDVADCCADGGQENNR